MLPEIIQLKANQASILPLIIRIYLFALYSKDYTLSIIKFIPSKFFAFVFAHTKTYRHMKAMSRHRQLRMLLIRDQNQYSLLHRNCLFSVSNKLKKHSIFLKFKTFLHSELACKVDRQSIESQH